MKSCIAGVIAVCSTTLMGSNVPPGPGIPPPSTHPLPKIIARAGGFVYTTTKGKPVRIVNRQKTVPVSVLQSVAKSVGSALSWAVEVVDSPSGGAEAGCVIEVVERADEKTLLVAPENAWAEVNVTPLKVDDPSPDKLAERTSKEVWRALCMALGASNSQYQPCLMRTVYTLKDLDAAAQQPCPEPFNAMNESARILGFSSLRRATYRTACREGWAPAPTNDIQKAIWDEAHTLPTNPLPLVKPTK